MNNIVTRSSIWDLHIHTCQCPKGTSEFSNLSIEKYLDKLEKIFANYENLDLISFTDYNYISVDVYKAYMQRQINIPFVVGIEVDVLIEAKHYKHLIVYFDVNKDNFNENIPFFEELNNYIHGEPIVITTLLNFIIEKKKQFILSPHAFKQGKRDINEEWCSEELADSHAHKYTDQFFCFWEASGKSQISRAIQFLKDFELDDEIQVISFSDSNNFKKLEDYLNNPPQYFLALPNYKGLEMVSTESRRIVKAYEKVETDVYGNLIGSVDFKNNTINFSNRLNCIIGGRGECKSLLLDTMAFNLGKDLSLEKRKKFRLN